MKLESLSLTRQNAIFEERRRSCEVQWTKKYCIQATGSTLPSKYKEEDNKIHFVFQPKQTEICLKWCDKIFVQRARSDRLSLRHITKTYKLLFQNHWGANFSPNLLTLTWEPTYTLQHMEKKNSSCVTPGNRCICQSKPWDPIRRRKHYCRPFLTWNAQKSCHCNALQGVGVLGIPGGIHYRLNVADQIHCQHF